jgi:hypothetical protein
VVQLGDQTKDPECLSVKLLLKIGIEKVRELDRV